MYSKGLVIICMIESVEDQEVATANITGSFLHTDYDKLDIQIKLEGAMVPLIEEINP